MSASSAISLALWICLVVVLWFSVTIAALIGILSVSISLALGLMPVQEVIFLIVMSGIVATYSPPRVKIGFLCASLVWTGWFVSHISPPSSAVALALLLVLLLLAAYGLGAAIRAISEKRDAAQQALVQAHASHRESLAAQRRTLARELHDIIAHDVTLIAMQAEAAQISGGQSQHEETLERIRVTSRSALGDLRRTVTLLKEDGLLEPDAPASDIYAEEVFPESLESLLEELRATMVDVQSDITGDWQTVAYSVRHALHQVMKECITNVMKYGSPVAGVEDPQCTIEAHVRRTEVWVRISNRLPLNGTSAGDAALSSGLGLESIRDRVKAYGGELTLGPDEHGQWWVCEVQGLGIA